MSAASDVELTERLQAQAEERRGVNERTACYKCYDVRSVLIYVGVTKNTGQRWWQHSQDKYWWRDVVHREVTWFDSRPNALVAERFTVMGVLDDSKAPMPSADAARGRRYAVAFATRVGWSKYQIATQLGLKPAEVEPLMVTGRMGKLY